MLPLAFVLGIGLTVAFALLGYSLGTDVVAVRVVSILVDAFFVGVAVLVVRELSEGPGEASYAWVLVGSIGLGAFLHGLGVLDWDGDAGFAARATGALLVVAPLALVPSTLTLALPLAAVLALSAFRSGTTAGLPRPHPRRSRSGSPG